MSAILIPALIVYGIVVFVLPKLPAIERSITEHVLNQNLKDFFEGPVQVEKVELDRELKLSIEKIHGNFKTRRGPVPLELDSFKSLDSLLLLLTSKPIRFIFKGGRPEGVSGGLSGSCTFAGGKAWKLELLGDLTETDLKDLRWLDPDDLSGATGATEGTFRFVQSADGETDFDMHLKAPHPGGELQAKFFDVFLPYLPTSAQRAKVKEITLEGDRLIKYQTADLQVGMPRTDQMKIFLQILILDYNLKLTLNVIVNADSKDAFYQIAQILGLIEVKIK